MSQKLQNDKIGSLSHSAGNIIMSASIASPAYLTIGGRQFVITSNMSVALPTLTANQRYQVFAVQSGGVPSLVISTNENSVGPSGFTRWKLVGSLYANGNSSVAFGSFVNIEGAPNTNEIQYLQTISANPTPPTKGTSNVDLAFWQRDAGRISLRWDFRMTADGTDGNGTYLFLIPTNILADLTKIGNEFSSSDTIGEIGPANGFVVGGTVVHGYMRLISSTQMTMHLANDTIPMQAVSNISMRLGAGTAGRQFSFKVEFAVSGWSSTPIKDL